MHEELKEMHREEIAQSDEETLCHELTRYLNCHFGIGLGPAHYFTGSFGSVLANLPHNVFLKLKRMRNLFFVFTQFLGGEVKILYPLRPLQKGKICIVTFRLIDIEKMSSDALMGCIAHELAHVYLEQELTSIVSKEAWEDAEKEADELAIEWGFEDNIKVLRDFRKRDADKPKPA